MPPLRDLGIPQSREKRFSSAESVTSCNAPESIARARLEHVRWLGGGSGAGKSTVAGRLAAEYGLRVYHTERFAELIPRTTPASAPMLHAFAAMDVDERWVNRPARVMFETFHGFHGECFDLVVADLLALPTDPPILVEGFTLLPRLVMPLITRPTQAVWLLPTPEFRRAAFDSRGTTWTIPRKASDPVRALENLLERDEMFTQELRSQAPALGAQVIEVGVGIRAEQLAQSVADALALKLLGGADER
jgi:2-phosphoglycerate kinase